MAAQMRHTADFIGPLRCISGALLVMARKRCART
jgi:hypothetical protein